MREEGKGIEDNRDVQHWEKMIQDRRKQQDMRKGDKERRRKNNFEF